MKAKTIKYHYPKKLVRAGSPSILANKGYRCTYSVLNKDQFRTELLRKIKENISLIDKINIDDKRDLELELAELQELFICLVDACGFGLNNIDEVRQWQNEKLGSYSARLFLEKYTEEIKNES